MKYFLIFLILPLLINCETRNNNRSDIKQYLGDTLKIYDSENDLKAYYIMKNESTKHGLYKKYYPNKQLKEEGFYKNNKLDSVQRRYYSSGTLKEFLFYKNGVLFAEHLKFYKDKYDEYFIVQDGDSLYYQDPLTREYLAYNKNGKIVYNIKYDTLGNIKRVEGNPIIHVDVLKGDLYKKGEIKIVYYLASPQWMHRRFEVKVYKNNQIISHEVIPISEKHSASFFDKKLEKDGSYKIIGVYRLKSTHLPFKSSDSLEYEVSFKPDV